MLVKPDLQDEKIGACLSADYGLPIVHLAFLPLGADLNTAVYQAVTKDGTPYFVKLRQGLFDETSVALPKFLHDQGVAQVIAPLAAGSGQLWAGLGAFKVILYPFIEGRNGYELDLADHYWIELGQAVKSIHTAGVPAALREGIQVETYSPQWRETLGAYLEPGRPGVSDDPTARELAAFLSPRRDMIGNLIRRANCLAQDLRANSPELVLCHSDLHAGNILVGADGAFYIVDWDNPIFAPKERDLMFPGGAQGFSGHTALEEESLFYQGYGPTQVCPAALAYYRYERIIQDLAVECEQIFLAIGGEEDRRQGLHYLASNFLPNNTIEMAFRADRTLEREPGG